MAFYIMRSGCKAELNVGPTS